MPSPANCKRHPAITAASTSGSRDMSPLATMYADLLQLVGWRLLSGDFSDYVRFRAVCRHWRSSTDSPFGRGIIDPRFHPHRWMMLPDNHGLHPADGRKRFFNLSLGAFICCRVPLLEDHRVLCTAEGLLLLQRQDDEQDNAIILLHPLTGEVAKFPPISYHTISLASGRYKSPERSHHLLPSGTVTASLSVTADGVPMIMITLSDMPRVLFATTDDKQWRFSAWILYQKGSTISSRGKLYVLQQPPKPSAHLRIFEIGPPRQQTTTMPRFSLLTFPLPKVIAVVCPTSKIREPFDLVECDSKILLVRHAVFNGNALLVYKLADLVLGRAVPLTSINGNALLVDLETSMSVSSRAMPIVAGDTVVRRDPKCDDSLEQYLFGSDTWSSTAGRCTVYL